MTADSRADRATDIVEANFGRVLGREGDVIEFEIPADLAPSLASIWGQSRLTPIFRGQSVRLAERRAISADGRAVVCPNDWVTTAFYRFSVSLST